MTDRSPHAPRPWPPCRRWPGRLLAALACAGAGRRRRTRHVNPVSKAFADTFADPSVIRGKDGYWYAYGTSDPLREGERHRAPHPDRPLKRPGRLDVRRRRLHRRDDAGLGRSRTPASGRRTSATSTGSSACTTSSPTPRPPPAGRQRDRHGHRPDPGRPVDRQRRARSSGRASDPRQQATSSGPSTRPSSPTATAASGSSTAPTTAASSSRRSSDDGTHGRRGADAWSRSTTSSRARTSCATGGWWYLFASTANCCAGPTTGYSVQVGRSREPARPLPRRDRAAAARVSRAGGTTGHHPERQPVDRRRPQRRRHRRWPARTGSSTTRSTAATPSSTSRSASTSGRC